MATVETTVATAMTVSSVPGYLVRSDRRQTTAALASGVCCFGGGGGRSASSATLTAYSVV